MLEHGTPSSEEAKVAGSCLAMNPPFAAGLTVARCTRKVWDVGERDSRVAVRPSPGEQRVYYS